MRHISESIAGYLDKLGDDKLERVRDLANRDTSSTSIKGANAREPARDMSVKVVAETQHFDAPSPKAPPTSGSTKPAHTWPAPTSFKAESGRAVAARLGTMPSRTGPGR
jgi:hypothetical protein